jgi:hypothetical protein
MFLIRYIMYRLKKTKRIMKDEMKKKVIAYIDYLNGKGWNQTAWRIELNNLRSKYIYKDISPQEFRKDVKWLGEFRKLDQLRDGVKINIVSKL